jgi:hypothetical protein
MSNTDLQTKINELNYELYDNSLLFFSEEIFKHEVFKDVEFNQEFNENIVNKIISLDGKYILSAESVDEFKFLEKASKLKRNYYKIIEYKDTMSDYLFTHLYTEYLKILNSCKNIAISLVDTTIKHKDKISEKELKKFVLQSHIFQSHYNEVFNIGHVVQAPKGLANPNIETLRKLRDLKKVDKKSTEEVKPFRDFIRHKKKEEIEKLVKEHFSDYRGVALRYLVEFLKDRFSLIINNHEKSKFHKSLKTLFDNKEIGTYNGIFSFQFDKIKDVKYDNFEKSFEKFFKENLDLE